MSRPILVVDGNQQSDRLTRIPLQEAGFAILTARDEAKDQSYFLFELSQEQLKDALFPLGDMTKPEVRGVAEKGGLTVAKKKESYEICFVPQKDGYGAVVEREAEILAARTDHIGKLAHAVVAHRRKGGVLPPPLVRFADLFTPRPESVDREKLRRA